jgi:hypothetical protein
MGKLRHEARSSLHEWIDATAFSTFSSFSWLTTYGHCPGLTRASLHLFLDHGYTDDELRPFARVPVSAGNDEAKLNGISAYGCAEQAKEGLTVGIKLWLPFRVPLYPQHLRAADIGAEGLDHPVRSHGFDA